MGILELKYNNKTLTTQSTILKVLKEDVIKKNKSVALRGVITIYRVLHPPRPINNFMTGNKTVMTRERQEYKAKFSVNRKEWVPSGKKNIKEIDI